ncbi:MAG: S53 family peptidase [Solirubrobacteraceae bacterium]
MLGAVVGLLAVPAVALAAPSKPTPVGQGTQVVVGPQIGTASSQPPTSPQCAAATGGAVQACYGPPSIRAQYDFNPLYADGTTGAGQTIVIFDSFGSPTITSDLAQFDSTYGIPAPPSFNIYQPEGTVHYLWTPGQPNSAKNKNAQTQVGWAEETTLDVEWAHAIAPGADIALVETPNAETQGVQGLQNLENAQRWALQNHIGTIWSDSFATTEQAFHNPSVIQRLNALYASARAQGVSAFFATGDTGVANTDKQGRLFPYPTVNFPSSSPDIISVGGTEIPSPPPAIGSYQPEAAWNDCCGSGGGGFSSVFSEPDYQSSAPITDPSGMRGLPDVSYNAALVSAILTYESLPSGSGWLIIGGTSAATPQWAALDALANQADGSLGFLAPRLYQIYANKAEYASAFHDITAGNNSFAGVTGYQAGPGWDAATGLGTPDADQLVQALKTTTP